jgi:hypothetical protein
VDPLITPTSAGLMTLDATFKGVVTSQVYTSPLYVESGPSSGTFYVGTEGNDIYALDEATGSLVWHQTAGTPATKPPCGNITGTGSDGGAHTLGITGTPAIDLGSGLIVYDAAIGGTGGALQTHSIQALSLAKGTPVWSVDVSTLKDATSGTAFAPAAQNERSAVLIVNGVAYVAYGGHYGDCGTYHGWVVGVPLSGVGAKAWMTQVRGAGIWGPGGPASDGTSIFVSTGNGEGDTATWQESEGMFRLDPGPSYTGLAADYLALNNWSALDGADTDLSGSQPLVIDAPSMTPSTLVMAQGKDGYLYLTNRTNMGGVTAAQHTAPVGALQVLSGEISNAGAWATVGTGATSTTYVVVRPNGGGSGIGCATGSGGLVAVKLDPTAVQKMSVVWCANPNGGGSPIITSDGTSDPPLVWVMGAEGSNKLQAWNLVTGASVPNKAAALPLGSGESLHHFTTPIVAHGRIFTAADYGLYAYKP